MIDYAVLVIIIIGGVVGGLIIPALIYKTRKPNRNIALYFVILGLVLLVFGVGSFLYNDDFVLWVLSPVVLGIFMIIGGIEKLRKGWKS